MVTGGTVIPLLASVAIAGRIVLGAVFVVAGVAKCSRMTGVEKTIVDLGLPRIASRVLALVVPLAEIAIGVLLLANQATGLAAMAALALLVLFTVTIAVNLIAGNRPSCNCFGEVSASPLSWWNIARNTGLAGLALALVLTPPISIDQLLTALLGVTGLTRAAVMWLTVGTALIVVQGVATGLLFYKYKLTRTKLALLEGRQGQPGALTIGGSNQDHRPRAMVAPTFLVRSQEGYVARLEDFLRSGKDVVLIFVHRHCQTCVELLADVKRWQHELSDRLTIVLLSSAPDDGDDPYIFGGIRNVFLEEDRHVSRLYGIHGTPGAILIGRDGTIAKPPSFGRAEMAEVIIEATTGRHVHFGDEPLNSLRATQAEMLNG